MVYREASVVGARLRDRLWVHSSHFIAPEYLKPQGPIEGLLGFEMVQRFIARKMRSCDVFLDTNSLAACL